MALISTPETTVEKKGALRRLFLTGWCWF